MSTFLNSDVMAPRGFVYDNDYQYHKLVGRDQSNQDLNFYVKHEKEWDGELGSCIEFKMNESPLLLAYCENEADFISILSSFNV